VDKQEPIAWMVYTLDGTSVCVTDNPTDFTENHRALPLYTTPQPQEFVCSTDKEKLAQWMIEKGYATGHGDTIEDLLQELEWQIAEKQEPVTFVCSTGLCRFTLTQTNVGIGERGMQAYEEAKKRGWVGISDEMEMPKQEPK